MPIYEYRCTNCGTEQEVLQKVSDPPLVDCPSCGKAAMVKKVTAAGFQLKGTGWYVTDFKNARAGKPAEADKKSAQEAANGSKIDGKAAADAKGDAQPAGKAETRAETQESKASDPKPGAPAA